MPALRRRIVEALRRDRVPDGRDEDISATLAELREILGPGVQVALAAEPPRDGTISPPIRPGRRMARTRNGLLADLASDRVYRRRQAAWRLGGWDGDPAVVEALTTCPRPRGRVHEAHGGREPRARG